MFFFFRGRGVCIYVWPRYFFFCYFFRAEHNKIIFLYVMACYNSWYEQDVTTFVFSIFFSLLVKNFFLFVPIHTVNWKQVDRFSFHHYTKYLFRFHLFFYFADLHEILSLFDFDEAQNGVCLTNWLTASFIECLW